MRHRAAAAQSPHDRHIFAEDGDGRHVHHLDVNAEGAAEDRGPRKAPCFHLL
ncbi:MAG: hypothetical protein M5U22_17765 [Thermoleophilia bacterium]|nr:hypothetical protein [Thermoleophilia bacterium]